MNLAVTASKLEHFGVEHRVVVARRDAIVKRESDGKEFGGLDMNEGESIAMFIKRAGELARKIEALLGEAVVVTINGQDMVPDRRGGLHSAAKHVERFERAKLAKKHGW